MEKEKMIESILQKCAEDTYRLVMSAPQPIIQDYKRLQYHIDYEVPKYGSVNTKYFKAVKNLNEVIIQASMVSEKQKYTLYINTQTIKNFMIEPHDSEVIEQESNKNTKTKRQYKTYDSIQEQELKEIIEDLSIRNLNQKEVMTKYHLTLGTLKKINKLHLNNVPAPDKKRPYDKNTIILEYIIEPNPSKELFDKISKDYNISFKEAMRIWEDNKEFILSKSKLASSTLKNSYKEMKKPAHNPTPPPVQTEIMDIKELQRKLQKHFDGED